MCIAMNDIEVSGSVEVVADVQMKFGRKLVTELRTTSMVRISYSASAYLGFWRAPFSLLEAPLLFFESPSSLLEDY